MPKRKLSSCLFGLFKMDIDGCGVAVGGEDGEKLQSKFADLFHRSSWEHMANHMLRYQVEITMNVYAQ